ncbi:MAG: PH domain-containing protein [Verrucomicrobia bacterium]|nr:PH domain-containing protein [Verrucomicrobiota bacterium]
MQEPSSTPDSLSDRPLPPILAAQPAQRPPLLPVLAGHLHPLTLVVVAFNAIRNLLIPAVIVLATGSQASLGVMLIFFLGLNLLQAFVRYFTFTYRVEGGELTTRQGLLERRERRIPLTRVQDLRLEQGLVHRLFGVVDLHVETAGGQGAEASLSVLSRPEAERLRQAVFEQVAELTRRGVGGAATAVPEAEVIRKLGTRDLVLAGLTSNQAASALVIVLAGWQFLDDFLPQATYQRFVETFASRLAEWVNQGDQANWLAIGAIAFGFIAVGLAVSVVGSLVLFHGFTLTRRGEDLHRSYGLLTRRSSSLPRRRIQLLQIQETWLRRLLRLATLRVDTAGSAPGQEQGREGRDVLLPVLPRNQVETLLPVLFPDLDSAATPWNDVSRCAIRRGTLKGAVVLVLLTAINWGVQRHFWALWPLLLLPVIYLINLLNFKHLGYALSDRFFWTRRGWLSRNTHVVPVRNAQTIVISQTPFDRRFGVATLFVDTAGQTQTASGPQLRNVPLQQAEITARALAIRAARTRYRWR